MAEPGKYLKPILKKYLFIVDPDLDMARNNMETLGWLRFFTRGTIKNYCKKKKNHI